VQMLTRGSIKRAVVPMGLGFLAGLAYGMTCLVRGSSISPAETFAILLVPGLVAGFLTWWAWLFWGALRADAMVRRLAPLGMVGVAVFIFLSELPAIRQASRFRQDGASTRGVVTGTYPKKHNRIGYRYAVGAVAYAGEDMAPGLASHFRVGDSIAVYFLRSEPAVSAARYPSETVGSVLIFSIVGALWMVAGVANVHHYIRRRKKPPTILLQRSG
jgi:hypothetical protein